MKRLNKLTPLLAALVLAASQSAVAATLTVTNTTDPVPGACDSDCSLREAIIAANGNGDATNIIVLPAGTYTLSQANPGGIGEDLAATGDLDILKSLTILGSGADVTIVDAAGLDRVFHVPVTSNADVTINDITISGGDNGGFGGGIAYQALSRTLKINRCSISGNTATGFIFSNGGGIFAQGDAVNSTSVVVSNSTISNNNAVFGGGFQISDGTAAVVNSTVSGNQAGNGGGIFVNNIASNFTVLSVTSSTITANESPVLVDSGSGLAIGVNGGSINLGNSIVGGNISDDNADCFANAGTINSVGFNLFNSVMGVSTCIPPQFGDKLFEGLVLPPLADNGGSTLTHNILPGSPAIDGGSPDDCQNEILDLFIFQIGEEVFAHDQRGQDRVIHGRCDIGSVEFGASADLAIQKLANVSEIGEGAEVTYTLHVKNEGPNTALDVVVTDDLPAGVTFVSASGTCTEAAGTVTCNVGSLANGETVDINVIVSTDAIADNADAVTITNTATVASDEDASTDNNSASADIVVFNQFNGAISGDGGCSLNPAVVSGGSFASIVTFLGLALAGFVRSRKNV